MACVFICLVHKKCRITKKPLYNFLAIDPVLGHLRPVGVQGSLEGRYSSDFPVHSLFWSRLGTSLPTSSPVILLKLNIYVHNHSFTLPKSTLKMEVVYITEKSATLPTSAVFEGPRAGSTSTMNHFESLKSVRLLLSFLLSEYHLMSYRKDESLLCFVTFRRRN